jgi:RNA ligase (TIGR02306 family)
MATFRVEVVPVSLEKHPNADSLSVVKVFDGYTVCVRTADWEGKDRGAYIPPDSVVPDTEQFAFLEGKVKIKAKRLRGIESYGMLVPAPEGAEIGDDVAEKLGIVHYEPELSSVVNAAMGNHESPPPMRGVIYDIESWQKYRNVFQEGEEVVITEKIHGMNSRFTYQDGKMYAGSRNHWVKEGDNVFWRLLDLVPWIKVFCQLNPNVILYGEIFGAVQKGYNYGLNQKVPYGFRAFDVYADGRFLNYDDALGGAKSDFLVPVLYRGPYSHEVVEKLMNGESTLPGAAHIREGVVIKPVIERFSDRLHGRLILKAVSIDYLEGKKKK